MAAPALSRFDPCRRRCGSATIDAATAAAASAGRPGFGRSAMNHALIVDDDVDAAEALKEVVAGARYTVSVAHSLRDARRQLALQQPDVVLLDLQLPDGSGIDLFADTELLANS